MITLEKFQGHLTLYCKGYYRVEGVDFITGLQRIWAIRCGIATEHIDDSFKEYIADEMYRIIQQTLPHKLDYMYELMHKSLVKNPFFNYVVEFTAIEKIIHFYRNEISQIQVKEKVIKNYRRLVKLPKPQRRLFNRIVAGNGRYTDYELVK